MTAIAGVPSARYQQSKGSRASVVFEVALCGSMVFLRVP